tara:strand:+ start:156 stop:431 length:276 start_codon:yes stop_codon:yes gene_type:complete
MKVIAIHTGTSTAFTMDLTAVQSAELSSLHNLDRQKVPYLREALFTHFGNHAATEVRTFVCSLLDDVAKTDSVGQTTFTQIENEIEGNLVR